jgi:N-succinyldiaminopimelate aminotransferase
MAKSRQMPSSRAPFLNSRLQGLGTSIFAEMTQLAREHQAVNLGQGFPDFDGPASIVAAARQALLDGHNQYTPPNGLPCLTEAIATHQARHRQLSYDPGREITVFAGATEAIFATIAALCEVGDEVVVFEPFYDSYRASIAMAGARERVVRLHEPEFFFDPDELRAAITAKTRLLLLNTPHNPTGKVFTRSELEFIAEICKEHDLIAVTDEVYEHLVFSGDHVSLAQLPGMRERTVVISSAGKTFSLTGWKVGHACAPPALTCALRCAHQFITFCTPGPLQIAVAQAYLSDDNYFLELRREYETRRDALCAGLEAAGLKLCPIGGTYFALTDIRSLGFANDIDFCKMLISKVGVVAIPTSVFYLPQRPCRHLVRWAFCKRLDTIAAAMTRLAQL